MTDAAVGGDLPQDAKIVIEILKSMGVEDYEPRVVNQLLEFMYSESNATR
jgi:transcription initiation factor TFIID subunit 9B